VVVIFLKPGESLASFYPAPATSKEGETREMPRVGNCRSDSSAAEAASREAENILGLGACSAASPLTAGN